MNERVKRLREETLNAVNTLSSERGVLITEFYKSIENVNLSVPVQRAMAFEYILTHKRLYIGDGELIVGERGPKPKATPTYPEICVHTQEDLDILNTRKNVSFKVDEQTRKDFRDIITPYWTGKNNRERIMQSMSPAWKQAFEAGIFTEFMEQRAPGHTVCGGKIYQMGMNDFIAQIDKELEKRSNGDITQIEELKAMRIAANAIITFANRHADVLELLAKSEADPIRKDELQKMAEVCRKIPANKPTTFHEALQYYWFMHLGVVTELNPWDAFNPGRLDQHLEPFYTKGIEEGTLTYEQARELLQCFWVKFNNHPSPPKVGITAQESSTYTDFCLINVGGVKDNGADGVNEVSFLILDVIEEMRLLQPSSMVQLSKKNPDSFIDRAIKISKTGFGQPSIFNTDAMVQEMLRQGKSIVDARRGGASGCVEVGAFGTEAYWLTGYFNLPKILELTLNNGFDPRTNTQMGLRTGDATTFTSYEQLLEAFEKQVNHFMQIKIEGNLKNEQIFGEFMPVPFLSLLIDDCITTGKDYCSGGARYNTTYVQGVGLGTITDCLSSLRYHVYEKGSATMQAMLDAIKDNFVGHEALRNELIFNTPKYGNDDDRADRCLNEVFEIYYNAVDGKPNARGGVHRVDLLPTTCHIYFGKVTGALPDGRKATTPLSEGISPSQGCDTHGPTAVVKSAAKIDHVRTGGTLLNMKFAPQFFNGDEAIRRVSSLVRSYFRLDGHHIQFNVVNADTLRKAQQHPELYRDLIVRVAGFSDYFNDLGPELQNEIISRTEHETV
ncbi:trans-4-hydroxy-L-proline dehydratase [uncultured Acetobacteroides sp.]|uniref:trans-4-hydroxy-L-proline dehydratase n=1 Tax=uncultured Acetobacteroides sp. TaxID=1760811 RepID=UPI0029F4A1D5|nr:trans-4-hydroxy-L-proline dehydratase [uncultured Acetobacteroides sp.]